ncbi:MAG: hypothetical protein M3680_01795, partial [Myxococcota bacterium]|nr:hypothetical protein [Myxococcota bacterium]
ASAARSPPAAPAGADVPVAPEPGPSLDEAYHLACDTASLRRFRTYTEECWMLAIHRCERRYHAAEALARAGAHEEALDIFTQLAFAPEPPCTATRALAMRAVEAAAAAGKPDHARELHERTVEAYGYPHVPKVPPHQRYRWRGPPRTPADRP